MTDLYIYDTLTRTKKQFQPLNTNSVNMYVCGVTVYDHCHIGHARVLVFFDTLVRYLQAKQYTGNYVRNITDVDDKIIKAAKKNNEDPYALTTRFIAAAQQDEAALNIIPPNCMPKATEYIQQMLQDITTLITKDYAYAADNGDVYYRVRKKESYGKLSKKNIDDLRAGARIEINTDKESPLDFALWKKVPADELGWESPWGYGRPGWHIECSSMAKECLTESLDIHGGGNDLIFPHHENEIAQSEAITGKHYVGTWMHTGHVCIDDEKMSKSVGNFFTIREVLKQYPGEVIRLFLLSNHYRTPINYTEQRLQDSYKGLKRLYTAIHGLELCECSLDGLDQQMQASIANFYQAMNDDFNTPVALAALFELAKRINSIKELETDQAANGGYYLKKLANLLGILYLQPQAFLQSGSVNLDIDAIECLIEQRHQARRDKDWPLADVLRDQLADSGIVISDKDGKTSWKTGV